MPGGLHLELQSDCKCFVIDPCIPNDEYANRNRAYGQNFSE